MRARVLSLSNGNVRISRTRLRVKPKLPAPINAIFVTCAPLVRINLLERCWVMAAIPSARGNRHHRPAQRRDPLHRVRDHKLDLRLIIDWQSFVTWTEVENFAPTPIIGRSTAEDLTTLEP